ncbi:outer membrane lipoprotein carrier protein LolA [Halosquirtibacter laminarini]|uniref:Outer membrane lipoprotein carrier protein LolA n=1 Tax=Halosquirtibacter laminarini TaxID=3374600 RepID=A0AC61NCG3_9BACT|nr:outer membrane lipoprotein carrier protein LolA [Prolixibacteraceae bacterium]
MKKAFIILSILLTSSSLFAQTDGKSIIDNFTKTLKSYPSIETTFDFTLENKEAEISDTNSGKLVIKNEKYRLDMLGIQIYSDGKTSYSFMPSTNEVNITNVGAGEEGSVDPSKMFNMYEEGMKVTLLNTVNKGNLKEYEIQLVPEEQDNFEKIIVYITSDNRLKKAITYAMDGNVYTISIEKMVTNKTFEDTYFKFDTSKYPEVDVIDMR